MLANSEVTLPTTMSTSSPISLVLMSDGEPGAEHVVLDVAYEVPRHLASRRVVTVGGRVGLVPARAGVIGLRRRPEGDPAVAHDDPASGNGHDGRGAVHLGGSAAASSAGEGATPSVHRCEGESESLAAVWTACAPGSSAKRPSNLNDPRVSRRSPSGRGGRPGP